jgi:glucose/arabinose dehydrogenase
MKRFSLLALCAALLGLLGCSESTDTQSQNAQPTAQATPQAPTQMPAGHPLNAQQQAAIDAAKDLPKQGTVKEMMHAAGYTYMSVDTGADKPIWIAATMMRVKPEDKVQWADAAVMKNFASKSLHRTFEEILFVSNASVVQ